MSIEAMSQVWKRGPGNQSQLIVMLALADHSDDDGYCWPSVSRIADKARTSERTVRRILAQLIADGWIIADRTGGRGRASVYQLRTSKWPNMRKKRVPDRVRATVYARDGFECQYCLEKIDRREDGADARTLDHVKPQSRGGSDTEDNLVVCCASCNAAKGDRTPQEWLNFNGGIKPDNLAAFVLGRNKGGQTEHKRRPNLTEKADTAMATQPSKNHQEPSIPPSPSVKTPPRGSRLPVDWRPTEDEIAYAAGKGLSQAEIARVAEDFADYWISKSGRDATKVDWSRVWQKWVRKVVDEMPSGSPLPADWMPSQTEIEYAQQKGFGHEEIKRIAADFADYWSSKGGKNIAKRDWTRVWQKWVRTEHDRRERDRAASVGKRSGAEVARNAAAIALARRMDGTF